jgi:excisionase family DNA binding protein
VSAVARSPSLPTGDGPRVRRCVTTEELCAYLQVHPTTVRRWARQGRLRHIRLSANRVVFEWSEIERFLEAHRVREGA